MVEEMSESLHFVVVAYQSSRVLGDLVESLRRQDVGWRATVVDNSQDVVECERLSTIVGRDDRICLLRSPKNLGYFGAARWAVTRQGIGAEWTIVCNPDIALADDFVSRLCSIEPCSQVLAPAITTVPGGIQQNPYMQFRPSVRRMLLRRLVFSDAMLAQAYSVARRWRTLFAARVRRPNSVDLPRLIYAPHGAVLVFHSSYFGRGGTLDHPLFLFNEELTVAECCRRLGMSISYEPGLQVTHHEHHSTGVKRSAEILSAQREAANYGYHLIRTDGIAGPNLT